MKQSEGARGRPSGAELNNFGEPEPGHSKPGCSIKEKAHFKQCLMSLYGYSPDKDGLSAEILIATSGD